MVDKDSWDFPQIVIGFPQKLLVFLMKFIYVASNSNEMNLPEEVLNDP